MGETGRSRRLLAGVALAGAISLVPVMAQDAPVTPPAAVPVIDGWGNFKFGMTMEQAAVAAPNMPFTNLCTREQLAKAGCRSIATKKGAVTIVGLPFTPRLGFDRFDRLYEIYLDYKEGGISSSACRSYFARVLDALETRYGPMQRPFKDRAQLAGEERYPRQSEGGSAFDEDVGPITTFYSTFTTDIVSFLVAIRKPIGDTHRSAERPFLQFGGSRTNAASECSLEIGYTAATLPQVNQGASSADNAKF